MMSVGKCTAIFLICSALFCAVSCADGHTTVLSDSNGETLRSQADKNDKDILWTRELESMRLGQNISAEDGIDKAVKLTPQTIIVSTSQEEPAYPFIDGFGSLDTSLISPELKTALDSFCRDVSSQQSADVLMADGCLYSYILFLDDLKTGWKGTFGEELPDAEDTENLFTGEIYGAPFIEDDYEIPVRLECNEGYADILICFIKDAGGYKINQIEIQKWGRADGK